jgi:Acylphosphatases
MQDTETYRAHIFISGKVQGVGFRYQLQQTARRLNLGGWVRNRRDGRVEAVLIGSRHSVEAGIAWAKQEFHQHKSQMLLFWNTAMRSSIQPVCN